VGSGSRDDFIEQLGEDPADNSSRADSSVFVRKDPRESPRPPDPSGSGLGEVTASGGRVADADPMRVCPRDGVTPLSDPDGAAIVPSEDLGGLMTARGLISAEQLATAERVVKQTPGKRLEQALMEMGVDEFHVQEMVARTSGLPFERIDADDETSYDVKSLNRLGLDYCKEKLVLPLRREGSRLVVGTVAPDDVFLLDDVKRRLGVPLVKHVLVASRDIHAVIDGLGESEAEEYDVNALLADVDEDDVEVVKEEMEEADVRDAESSPVVRYVNHIIQTALKEGASDIHIEPDEKSLRVRFRIDGVLFEMMNPPRKMLASLTSRIKIMANLDIAERRLPQDGRIRVTVLGRKVDLRVSTVPTARG
jgi:type IV pilus assembly protein PilB